MMYFSQKLFAKHFQHTSLEPTIFTPPTARPLTSLWPPPPPPPCPPADRLPLPSGAGGAVPVRADGDRAPDPVRRLPRPQVHPPLQHPP